MKFVLIVSTLLGLFSTSSFAEATLACRVNSDLKSVEVGGTVIFNIAAIGTKPIKTIDVNGENLQVTGPDKTFLLQSVRKTFSAIGHEIVLVTVSDGERTAICESEPVRVTKILCNPDQIPTPFTERYMTSIEKVVVEMVSRERTRTICVQPL